MLQSLHIKCHHQIVFSKINLNVFYPPPYQGLVWDYKKANIDCIRKSLNSVDWEFVLSNKNLHQQAQYLTKILMNVFSNYSTYQINWSQLMFTIDVPPWMNDLIKNKIKRRDMFYQQLKKYNLSLTDFMLWMSWHQNFLQLFPREKMNIIYILPRNQMTYRQMKGLIGQF